MGRAKMSEREPRRVSVLGQLDDGRIDATTAAQVTALSRRQAFRFLRRLRDEGPSALAHRARGRTPNSRIGDAVREILLDAVREEYADLGPTLAADTLAERHGLRCSVRRCPAVEDRGSVVAHAQGAPPIPSVPPAPRESGRTGPDRRLAPSLVRGSRASLHAARLRRRRDEPAGGAAVRAFRDDGCLFHGAGGLPRRAWAPRRILLRQAHRVPRRAPCPEDRSRDHPVRSRAGGVGHRDHLRRQQPGQGACRAREPRAVRAGW